MTRRRVLREIPTCELLARLATAFGKYACAEAGSEGEHAETYQAIARELDRRGVSRRPQSTCCDRCAEILTSLREHAATKKRERPRAH